MKILIYSLAGFMLLLLSCKKGKDLSQEVTVQLVMPDEAYVYPKDHFPPFDRMDPFEVPQYPHYAHDLSPKKIANQFADDLTSYLKDNNIRLQKDSAEYRLVISGLDLSESLERHSYENTCNPSSLKSYVYSSSLTFTGKASLYKAGNFVASWEKEGKSWERVKSDVTSCNAPKIGIMFRQSSSLISQVAKALRVPISKKMKELAE